VGKVIRPRVSFGSINLDTKRTTFEMTDLPVETGSDTGEQPTSLARRILLAVVAFIVISSLMLNLLGLTNWIFTKPPLGEGVVGLTEVQIVDRYGEPDYRSPIQTFAPGEGFGMLPKRLQEGEEYYYLNYTVFMQRFVFHLVSPQTFMARIGRIVEGQEWVVLEYYRGSTFVIY
jgi:hypothetical protein